MRLLLLDLDNTLLDREGAFRRWAAHFVAGQGARPQDVRWLVEADRDGLESRAALAASIVEHFELDTAAYDDVLATLQHGFVEHIELDERIRQSLRDASAAGWASVVVTNGTVSQQERKLRVTGLDRHVDGWVISEGAGVPKPDPRIFARAAEIVGRPLAGWMVGDNAEADIAGAQGVGLSTVWLDRGRQWVADGYRPTRTANSCAQAIADIVRLGHP